MAAGVGLGETASRSDPRPSPGAPLTEYLPVAPQLLALAIMVVWAVHDGGYDADTWYWGALALVALLAVTVMLGPRPRMSKTLRLATGLFAAYTAWSYASIAWASYPGAALTGSNRTLLYFVVFCLFAIAPWTPRRAALALTAFALAVGALAALLLMQMAGGHGGALFSEGRLVSPTGYFNASAALFTAGALLGVALAAQSSSLPLLLRATLLGLACCELQLAVLAQSRGWLFTLPVIALAAAIILRDRWKVALLSVLPMLGVLAVLPSLLRVYQVHAGSTVSVPAVVHAARTTGRAGLVSGVLVLFAAAILLTVAPRVWKGRRLRRRRRPARIGQALLALVLIGGVTLALTARGPSRLISRQWHGFIHPSPSSTSGSHFASVGSGRYDFWRVSLDALVAHPVGGLGQDNFANYYVVHRRTSEEPAWTHSLEMRLLAHTGLVGFALFTAFVVSALLTALRTRRLDGPGALAAAALMPLVVWLVHGSVDWFWEMPALSAPALAFLGLSASTELAGGTEGDARPLAATSLWAYLAVGLGVALAALVLGFPYLSVREVSTASDLGTRSPVAALRHLRTAAELNPLDATPGRLAGTIALKSGLPGQARQRFVQATQREPGGWFAWLGAGLAASALGDTSTARRDYERAASINSRQPAVRAALARLDTKHPMTPSEAFRAIAVTQ